MHRVKGLDLADIGSAIVWRHDLESMIWVAFELAVADTPRLRPGCGLWGVCPIVTPVDRLGVAQVLRKTLSII